MLNVVLHQIRGEDVFGAGLDCISRDRDEEQDKFF